MRTTLGILTALALTTWGCASGGTGADRSSASNSISEEELETVSELNCYEAVQRLRPNWLRPRGRISMELQQGIQLYVDGIPRGYVTELTYIRANAAQSMRFLSGREATARYGIDHPDGAIVLTTKRGP